MDKYQEAREGLAKIVRQYLNCENCSHKQYIAYPCDICKLSNILIDSLLSCRSPSGLRLAMVDDKAELLDNPNPCKVCGVNDIPDERSRNNICNSACTLKAHWNIVNHAQQDMRKAGYRKVVGGK